MYSHFQVSLLSCLQLASVYEFAPNSEQEVAPKVWQNWYRQCGESFLVQGLMEMLLGRVIVDDLGSRDKSVDLEYDLNL